MKTKKWKRDKKRWNNYWVLVSKTGDSGSWWRQAPGHPQWPSSPCRCCAWQPPLHWLTCWLELAVENQVTKIELQTCWAKMIKMSPELLVLKAHLFHTGNSNSEYKSTGRHLQGTHGTLRVLCQWTQYSLMFLTGLCDVHNFRTPSTARTNPCRTRYMSVTNKYSYCENTIV